jgi:hypothetical protein
VLYQASKLECSFNRFSVAGQEAATAEVPIVDRPTIVTDVDRELDDALSTVWLVRGNPQLSGRLFDQVVDLLLERILLDLRTELVAGRLTANSFAAELATLADQCRAVGLLTPDK